MPKPTIPVPLRVNAISHSQESALSQLRECIMTRFHGSIAQPFCGFAELRGFGSIMIHRHPLTVAKLVSLCGYCHNELRFRHDALNIINIVVFGIFDIFP
jgi:hypothetical protein